MIQGNIDLFLPLDTSCLNVAIPPRDLFKTKGAYDISRCHTLIFCRLQDASLRFTYYNQGQ